MVKMFRAWIAHLLSYFTVAKPVVIEAPVPVRKPSVNDIVWKPITRRPKGLHSSYKEYTKFEGHFFYLNKSGVAIAIECGLAFKVVKFSEGGSAFQIIHNHVYGKRA